jgi:hypothetical protein
MTMATVVVDRATLELGVRPFFRAELVRAARTVVDTSESRVSGYSVELKDALEATGGVSIGHPLVRLDATRTGWAGTMSHWNTVDSAPVYDFFRRRPPTTHLPTHRSVLAPCGRCARSHNLTSGLVATKRGSRPLRLLEWPVTGRRVAKITRLRKAAMETSLKG